MVSELVRRGNLNGQRVEVDFHDRVAQIIAVLALSCLGAGTIVSQRNNGVASGSVDIVLSDHASRRVGQAVIIDLPALLRRSPDDGGAVALERNECSDLAFAGNAPRDVQWPEVRITLARFNERILQRYVAKCICQRGRSICAADLRSEIGLSSVLGCLWSGSGVILSSDRFEDDVQAAGLYRVNQMLLASATAGKYLAVLDDVPEMAVSLAYVTVTGMAFDEPALHCVRTHLTNDVRLVLDCPEVGTFAANAYSGTPAVKRKFSALPGVQMRATDEIVATLDAAKPIRIAISAPGAVEGYANAPGLNLEWFREGWFVSPLYGSLHSDGAFEPIDIPLRSG